MIHTNARIIQMRADEGGIFQVAAQTCVGGQRIGKQGQAVGRHVQLAQLLERDLLVGELAAEALQVRQAAQVTVSNTLPASTQPCV